MTEIFCYHTVLRVGNNYYALPKYNKFRNSNEPYLRKRQKLKYAPEMEYNFQKWNPDNFVPI